MGGDLPDATFFMEGTDGTGEYRVLMINSLGRIGVRPLNDGHFRVRVEPASEAAAAFIAQHLTWANDWSQPDGQFRFSKVVNGDDDSLDKAIREAMTALGVATVVNASSDEGLDFSLEDGGAVQLVNAIQPGVKPEEAPEPIDPDDDPEYVELQDRLEVLRDAKGRFASARAELG